MAVREGLLALLHQQPAHGYQLKTGFEAATGGVWSLNVGQVYATLDRLERDGLVASAEREGQRSYSITASGTEELGAWWDAVPGDDPPPRDELTVKVLLAISHDRERALEVITHQRNALLMLLQQRQRATPRRSPKSNGLVDQLVRDALIVRAEADLRWLDLCEERISQEATTVTVSDDEPTAKRGRARRARKGRS